MTMNQFNTRGKVLLRQLSHWNKKKDFDVIVVGGGHAGTEACTAAARMGANTLLITQKISSIGVMSCNPSFGGIGKGHLMKEVDALDGICSRICDESGIHFKILNKRKGPAVWGYRAQIDRSLYKKNIQEELFNTANLSIIESSVEDFILSDPPEENLEQKKKCYSAECNGVILDDGREVYSPNVVLTTGTFLRGEINLGLERKPAGRMGDAPSVGLANSLDRLGFQLGRLKTGTPPRLDKTTIDFSACIQQKPDYPPQPFSFLNDTVKIEPDKQVLCHLTFSNTAVEKIIHETLHLNRHVSEEVRGVRYCPSLESKVLRFPGIAHQIWLEPEGLDSPLIYPQGLTCTMPPEKQQQLLNLVPGLEKCEMVQPGYGVEYDFVNPQELDVCLETNKIAGLFFAGQINGTTGYEEAAAQGLVAGANAASQALGKPPLKIDRTEGYIGVLIDDLTNLGTLEPYRMFTARSEFRMKLRPDNADMRLTEKGYISGCVSEERYLRTKNIKEKLDEGLTLLQADQRTMGMWAKLLQKDKFNAKSKTALEVLGLYLWDTSLEDLANIDDRYKSLAADPQLAHRLKLEGTYFYATQLESKVYNNLKMNQAFHIPPDFDYHNEKMGLRRESIEIMSKIRPSTIAEASRIPGVTPACLTSIMPYIVIKK